ncbi:MAG: hypothetical protein ACSHX5_00755 [Phycisphaerales bacterium]
MNPKLSEIKPLIDKLSSPGVSLSEDEKKKVAHILVSSGITIAMLETKSDNLRRKLVHYKNASAASSSVRSSTLVSLKQFKPTASTVDRNTAIKAANQLRADIKDQSVQTKNAIAGLKFAVKVAGKFI